MSAWEIETGWVYHGVRLLYRIPNWNNGPNETEPINPYGNRFMAVNLITGKQREVCFDINLHDQFWKPKQYQNWKPITQGKE